MKKLILSAIFLIGLNGCSLPFKISSSARTNYILMPNIEGIERHESIGKSIAVRDVLSSGFINSHRILFSKSPGQVGYFQYAVWSEFPATQITELILMSLQRTGYFTSVSRTTSGAISQLQLNAELLDFTFDLSKSSIHVVLFCELVDLQTRGIIGSRVIEVSEQVTENDADGAVKGFNKATAKTLKDVSEWLGQLLSTTVAPAKL